MKRQIKTVSFDLWNTLIKPNPEYKIKRNEYISSNCNQTPEEINEIFDSIKKDADETVEKFGVHFDTNKLYAKVYSKLYRNKLSHMKIKEACERIFLANPPILVEDAKDILSKLKSEGYDIFLSSNTLFIQGKVLREALIKLEIYQYFYQTLFSNELEVSKPNPLFFKSLHEYSYSTKSEIVHVGDSLVTDVVGANNYGINSYHISNLYNTTLTSFYNQLTNNENA